MAAPPQDFRSVPFLSVLSQLQPRETCAADGVNVQVADFDSPEEDPQAYARVAWDLYPARDLLAEGRAVDFRLSAHMDGAKVHIFPLEDFEDFGDTEQNRLVFKAELFERSSIKRNLATLLDTLNLCGTIEAEGESLNVDDILQALEDNKRDLRAGDFNIPLVYAPVSLQTATTHFDAGNFTQAAAHYAVCLVSLYPWTNTPLLFNAQEAWDFGLAERENILWRNLSYAAYEVGIRCADEPVLKQDWATVALAAADACLRKKYITQETLAGAYFSARRALELKDVAGLDRDEYATHYFTMKAYDTASAKLMEARPFPGEFAHHRCAGQHICGDMAYFHDYESYRGYPNTGIAPEPMPVTEQFVPPAERRPYTEPPPQTGPPDMAGIFNARAETKQYTYTNARANSTAMPGQFPMPSMGGPSTQTGLYLNTTRHASPPPMGEQISSPLSYAPAYQPAPPFSVSSYHTAPSYKSGPRYRIED